MARSSLFPASVQPGKPILPLCPPGWTTVTFGDVLEIVERPIDLIDNVEYQLVTAKRSRGGVVARSRLLGRDVLTKTQFQIARDDFLMSNRQIIHGGCGIVPPALDGAVVSNEYSVLRPKSRLLLEFLGYLSHSIYFQQTCFHASVGVDVEKMIFDCERWLDFKIHLPPFHEQSRIAEILSSVDEVIAATRAVIDQTRKVKQGVLERLLTKGIGHTRFKQTEIGEIPEGWEVATIEAYLTRLIDYRGVPPPKSDSGVPLITAKNVRFGYLNPEPREYISEDDFDGWMRRGLPEAGDVLFTTEAPLGNVAQIPDYKIALGQRTITLCPDKARLTPTFLKWLLLSPGSQARIAQNATGSTALGIKQSTFRKLKFPFPPLDEQKTIADHIEGIAAAEGAGTSKLESLNMLKAALMSDLLTGRKRVTDAHPMAAE